MLGSMVRRHKPVESDRETAIIAPGSPDTSTRYEELPQSSFDNLMHPSALRRIGHALALLVAYVWHVIGMGLELVAQLFQTIAEWSHWLSDGSRAQIDRPALPRLTTSPLGIRDFQKRALPEREIADNGGLSVTLVLFAKGSDEDQYVAVDVGSYIDTCQALMHFNGATADQAVLDATMLLDDAINWHMDTPQGPDEVQLPPTSLRAGLVTLTVTRLNPETMGTL